MNDHIKKSRNVYKTMKTFIPKLAFIIRKSTNDNVVIYEGNMTNNHLNIRTPIKSYWLDIDEKYMANNRHTKISETKSNITYFEKYAYGFKTELTKCKGYYKLYMNALPSKDIYINVVKDNILVKTMINSYPCKLDVIYVDVAGSWTPNSVTLIGKNLQPPYDDKEEIIKS